MFLGESANLDNFHWKDSQHSNAFATGTSNPGTWGYPKCTAKQIPTSTRQFLLGCRGNSVVSYYYYYLSQSQSDGELALLLVLPPITRISPGAQLLSQFLWRQQCRYVLKQAPFLYEDAYFLCIPSNRSMYCIKAGVSCNMCEYNPRWCTYYY